MSDSVDKVSVGFLSAVFYILLLTAIVSAALQEGLVWCGFILFVAAGTIVLMHIEEDSD